MKPGALWLACVVLLGSCTTQPVQLAGAIRPPQEARTPPSRCAVTIGDVRDVRREPRTLGVITGRAVKAPADAQAWIHSALQTLESRGITPVPATGTLTGSPSPPLTASITLQQFWVTSLSTNKAANLVLNVEVLRSDGRTALAKSYRGARTVMNWASGEGEIQRLIDDTWADALNQLGADLLALCGA